MSEKFNQYKILSEYYINSISGLLDFSNSINIIPIKYSIFIKNIKTYITDNKMEMIKNGLLYILNNKEDILKLTLDTLKSKDNDEVLNFFEKFDDGVQNVPVAFACRVVAVHRVINGRRKTMLLGVLFGGDNYFVVKFLVQRVPHFVNVL